MRSELNRNVPPAGPTEFAPLVYGDRLRIDPPVVLAPMAGVTNAPFRTLCRELAGGGGLFISEMITARSFALGNTKTRHLASFSDAEKVRSIQLYGTHPSSLTAATQVLVDEWGIDHIDLNFGCPVRKVTSRGGGSALPARPRLLASLIRAVVGRSRSVPVTVKLRKGIDDGLLTYLEAGRVAQEEGCAAVALHGRTAADLYSGEADWAAIGELKAALDVPVLGNGDIFEAWDALRMMRTTGCDGVLVGRGCLGRPWLFRELADVFAGREPAAPPNLGQIADIVRRHAELLVDFFGETIAMQHMRKFISWYTKSFPGTGTIRERLQHISTTSDLEELLRDLPADLPFPEAGLRVKRCKAGSPQRVSLPDGFLDDTQDARPLFPDPLECADGG